MRVFSNQQVLRLKHESETSALLDIMAEIMARPTDQPADQQTNRQTDTPGHTGGFTSNKKQNIYRLCPKGDICKFLGSFFRS